ncbi:hypothetical protein VPH35_109731 [Triticum aestivum]
MCSANNFVELVGSINPLFPVGEELQQRMDCVLELLDLASPAQLPLHAPDLATVGLAPDDQQAQIHPFPPPVLHMRRGCGARSREPANGGHRISVSFRPPPDPPRCAMDGRLAAPPPVT